MQITVTAAVIRDFSIDDDRILWLLTKEYGVITAYAKGARKPSGRMTASTEILSYSKFILFHYKDRYTINTAELERAFIGIRKDIVGLSLASYICELTAELAPKEQPADEHLKLFLNTLHYIENQLKGYEVIKPLYELRLMTLSGFMPNLLSCVECGKFEDSQFFFDVTTGNIICCNCYKSSNLELISLNSSVLSAMRHIIYSENSKLFSFNLSYETAIFLSQICEKYTLYHVEKSFKSLEFYRKMT